MPTPLTVGRASPMAAAAPAPAPVAAPAPILALPAKKPEAFVPPPSVSRRTPAPAIVAPEPEPEVAEPEEKVIEQNFTIKRRELNREMSDFDGLLRVASVSVVDGEGIMLTRLAKGSWWHKIGLREGDLISSVAGERIASVDDAALVYARMQSLGRFDIELKRGEKLYTLHYRVR